MTISHQTFCNPICSDFTRPLKKNIFSKFMEEELNYFTELCQLVDLKLMKTIEDDTHDDPKPKVKRTQNKKPNLKKQGAKNDSDVDEEAGPTTPKMKPNKETYNKMRELMKETEKGKDENINKNKNNNQKKNFSNEKAKKFDKGKKEFNKKGKQRFNKK